MKYILAVGIIFKKYKRPMAVTIRSKKFIDSFIIDEDIGYKDHPEARRNEKPPPKFFELRALGEFPYLEIPNKFNFYEIDHDALGDKLSIDFDCEDNNYTNGFMTKTGMFKLRMICIIPKQFFKFFYESKGQHRAFQRMQERSSREYFQTPDSIWPYNRKTWSWSSANTDLEREWLHIDPQPVWLGGKMQVHIPIIKKFGIKMLDPYGDRKYGFILSNIFCYKYIFEKYYQLNMLNEDK
tara:strand:- start:228 stop:944 length:717 start_codon:yes stop_codon:yes gene_type:complete